MSVSCMGMTSTVKAKCRLCLNAVQTLHESSLYVLSLREDLLLRLQWKALEYEKSLEKKCMKYFIYKKNNFIFHIFYMKKIIYISYFLYKIQIISLIFKCNKIINFIKMLQKKQYSTIIWKNFLKYKNM